LVAGAGGVGLVELFAQAAAFGELHHRQVARHFQAEPVAGLALGFGLRPGGLQHVVWNACHFVFGGVVGKGIGSVERVFAEFLAEFGLALLDLRESLLGSTRQLGAREHKVANGVLVRLALLVIQAGHVDGLVLGIQAFVGAQARPEFGDAGHGGVVGGAQLWGIRHAVEVADGAPGAAQVFGSHIEHAGNAAPGRRKVGCRDLRQRCFGLGEQVVHCRADMLGQDLVKQGKVGEIEEWIGHHV